MTADAPPSASASAAAAAAALHSFNIVTRTTSPPRRSPASPTQSPVVLECDYDVRPTQLYKCIQQKEWKSVVKLLDDPDTASQATIWVIRKETNGKLRWRLLPLHAALIFQAPHIVIESLLTVHPAAASCKDDQGMLPLHLVLRNRPIPWAVVEELVTAHPAAVYTPDRKGRTPVQGGQSAASSSNESISESNDNASALSVLQLFTQIAVARERNALNKAHRESDVTSNASSLAALSQQHAVKLMELQNELELERLRMQEQLAHTKVTYESQLQDSSLREGALVREVDRLQTKIQSQQDQIIDLLKCSQSMPVTSRLIQLESENAGLLNTVSDLMEHSERLATQLQSLSDDKVFDDCQRLLVSYMDRMQLAHSHRQAKLAVCRETIARSTAKHASWKQETVLSDLLSNPTQESTSSSVDLRARYSVDEDLPRPQSSDIDDDDPQVQYLSIIDNPEVQYLSIIDNSEGAGGTTLSTKRSSPFSHFEVEVEGDDNSMILKVPKAASKRRDSIGEEKKDPSPRSAYDRYSGIDRVSLSRSD